LGAVICSLATANPCRYVSGEETYRYFNDNWNLTVKQDELYKKVLLKGPIKGRYIAIDHDNFAELPDQDKLIEQFTVQARKINLQVSEKALDRASLCPSDIGAIVINTCTGYLCPGLSSYLIQDLNLSSSTKVFDLTGMGCGAAIPNIEFASSLVNQNCGFVLSISVEICSATIFNSPDPGCVISNCIFADGAAAAVVSAENNSNKPLIKILDFQTGVYPQYRDYLKFVSDHGKLRNVLSPRVPVIGAKTISDVTLKLLERNDLSLEDIHHWAIHPGGTAVIEQVRRHLKLSFRDVSSSLKIFENHGNMSSPSVMFVLKEILDSNKPQPDQLCCALSFGAGFSAHAALLQIV
jgi:predicted naringenin-chalcone synthase